MRLKMSVLLVQVVWIVSTLVQGKMNESLVEPLASKDGDLLIVGIFEIGIL